MTSLYENFSYNIRINSYGTDCNIVVYLGLSLVLYSHPSDVGISVSLDIS